MFGLVHFNRTLIADEVQRRTGITLELGRLNWQADSYHIYGKDIAEAEQRLMKRLDTTSFEERIYRFWDPMIQEIYRDAEADILRKIETYDAEHPD